MYAQEHGDTWGVFNWLASQIGASRQSIEYWGKRTGIPQAFVEPIHKLTGLKRDEIRPEVIAVYVPLKIWKEEATKRLIAESVIRSTTKGRKYG